jgi:hypothetical protein
MAAGEEILLNSTQTGSGAHQASYSMVTAGFFLVLRWPGHEADHSPTSKPEVKNGGATPALHRTFSWNGA